MVETPRAGSDAAHICVRVGGGWQALPTSPRRGASGQVRSPRSRRRDAERAEAQSQLEQRTPARRRSSSPRNSARRAERASGGWFLETIGRPVMASGGGGGGWARLRARKSQARKVDREYYREMCDEMRGWF